MEPAAVLDSPTALDVVESSIGKLESTLRRPFRQHNAPAGPLRTAYLENVRLIGRVDRLVGVVAKQSEQVARLTRRNGLDRGRALAPY